MSKTTKGSMKSKMTSAKSRTPKYISKNPSGTYRVRKMSSGQTFDKSFSRLKDAVAVAKSLCS